MSIAVKNPGCHLWWFPVISTVMRHNKCQVFRWICPENPYAPNHFYLRSLWPSYCRQTVGRGFFFDGRELRRNCWHWLYFSLRNKLWIRSPSFVINQAKKCIWFTWDQTKISRELILISITKDVGEQKQKRNKNGGTNTFFIRISSKIFFSTDSILIMTWIYWVVTERLCGDLRIW